MTAGSANSTGITLIVVSYNHERFLPQLLRSIDAQTTAPEHVILCDDNSHDDSPRLLEAWSLTTPLTVTLHLSSANRGLPMTLNQALSEVDTAFYAYISADDVMAPTRLARQHDVLASGLDAFVYSDATVIDQDGRELRPAFIERFLPPGSSPTDDFRSLLELGNWIPAASVMARASSVRAVHGYDESLFFEDYDLWLRLSRTGTFTHVPEPLVAFRQLQDSLGATRFNDADDEWQWAKVRIRAKHLGIDSETDRLIAGIIRPWLVTLAARGHDRKALAPLFRAAWTAEPTFATTLWAVLASLPIPGLLHRVARGRRP